MTALKDTLGSICDEVEDEVKTNLRGFTGILVRGYLPQRWIFKTENEIVTFSVDKNGNASVKNGAGTRPDVTIDINHEYLSAALTARRQPSFASERSNVKFHTSKGKTAYNFLRKRFGL